MEPRDVHFLMLLVQREVQLHVDTNRIGVDNTAGFHLSYDQQIPGTFQHLSGLPVQEFEYNEDQDVHLPDLPDIWQTARTSDFRAVVKVTYTRNTEEYSLVFSSGFKVGTGRILDN